MTRVERRSHCKVNLLLNILGKRPDGFHELETIIQPVRLLDVLSFELRPGDSITLTCNRADLPTDSRNLVVRAAELFRATARVTAGLQIQLEKRVPMAAGLGGGSANAAAALLALNELFQQPLSSDQLTDLAARLGSDVPFFLQDGPALGTGRGEQITPLPAFNALREAFIVLVHPGFGVSTPWAYHALAAFPEAYRGRPGRAQALVDALNTGPLSTAAALFYNSLEAPVLHKYPVLKLYQEFFLAGGASATLMSGSGSTTFAIVQSEAQGKDLLSSFAAKFGHACWTAVLPMF